MHDDTRTDKRRRVGVNDWNVPGAVDYLCRYSDCASGAILGLVAVVQQAIPGQVVRHRLAGLRVAL